MKTRLLVVLCAGLAVPVWARPFNGRIVNADNKPIAGARVSLFPFVLRDAKPLQQTQSDGNGAVSVDVPSDLDDPNNLRILQIEVPGAGVLVDAVSPASPSQWKVAPATSLSGQAVDENGAPISGATVKVVYLSRDRMMLGYVQGLETRTDAAGRWTLNRLPDGYGASIEVRAPGKTLTRFDVLFERNAAPFPPVVLRAGYDARGVVRSDEGKPVAGITVSSDGDGQNNAVTNAKGEFTLENLPLQACDVRFQDLPPELFPPGNVRVSPEKPTLAVQLEHGVPLSGRFVDSATKQPVSDISFSVGGIGSEKPGVKPDATGRFHAWVPRADSNAALRASGPTFFYNDVSLDAAKIALGDIGDVPMTRGTVWKGKILVDGHAPGEMVFFNLTSKSTVPLSPEEIAQAAQDGRPAKPPTFSAQIQAGADGTFQSGALQPGDWTFNAQQWKFQPVAPLHISIPAPSEAPFVRDVAATKLPEETVRGRIQTPDGAPVPYATVTLKSGDGATTHSDGSWQTSVPVTPEAPRVEHVSLGDATLSNFEAQPQHDGNGWTFAPLEWNDARRTVRVQVRDEAGQRVTGAQVIALWNREFRTALTDGNGAATFALPSANVQFFAAKELLFGAASATQDASVALQLRAPQNDAARAKAETILADQHDASRLLENWNLLAPSRLREASLQADGAKPGRNYGQFLSSLEFHDPQGALKEIPFVEGIGTPEREQPFELRQAEESLALLAARSNDEAARAWARRWLDGARRDFNAPVELKPGWAGGDQTSRFLAAYAVATSLKDPLARSFFDAAVDALPATENNPGAYSYPGYFSIDDPNLAVFREALPLNNQLDFAAASAFSAHVETPAQAKEGLAQLEAVAASPAVRAKVSADSVARSLNWARVQTLGILLRDPNLPLRPVLEQLRALDTTYQAGDLTLAAAQFAWDRGDKPLSREFIELGRERGWFDERAWFDSDEPKTRARQKFLEAAFPAATAAQAPDVNLLRALALTNLREGERPIGNQMPDESQDARRLRSLDPALGRLILEARWARLGPLNDDGNRFTARALATAMEKYDPLRALDWLGIARGEQVKFAARLVAPEGAPAAP